MKKVLVLVGAMLCLTALPALAQEEKVSVQQRDADAITLDVGDDALVIGYWHKMSDRTDVGLDFGLYYSDVSDTSNQQYSFSPALKRYLAPDKEYSPYLYTAIVGHYYKYDNGIFADSERYAIGAAGGFGLEWFPIKNVSIGGHVGVRALYEVEEYESVSGTTMTSQENKEEGFSIRTFSSGVRLTMFF